MKNYKEKSFSFELKNLDDKQGLVEFYFASFKEIDSDGDIILPTAYNKTLEETIENTHKSRIKHFKNHDPRQVVGVIKRFGTDDKGAYAVSQMSRTQLGRDTLIEYEEGIITEHSQGFQIMQEERDEMEGHNIIKEIKLWEVSSLTHWGANKNTPLVGIKSEKDILSLMQKLDNLLTSSKISDERAVELVKMYDKLGQTMKSLEKPSEDTLKADKEKEQEQIIINKLKNTFNIKN
jgi:HK97 family phage prohead protease